MAWGVFVLNSGTFRAGSEGLPVPFLSAAMVGTVLGWGVGEQSISVAAQVGWTGDLDRPIFVHAAISRLGAMSSQSPALRYHLLASSLIGR
ncbi:DUF7519 family protein [Halorhabdus salina]